MGKVEENKMKKKKALLTQAFELFLSKGINETTIADISSRAGVGKGTFYFYFKDKNDLIEYLIADKANIILNHAAKTLENASEEITDKLTVEDKIIILIDDTIGQLSNEPRLLKFISKNLSFGFYNKLSITDDDQNRFVFMEKYIELLESDGSSWRAPDLMLYTIVELVSSSIHSVILKKDPVDLETYKPVLFDSIRAIVSAFRVK